LPTPEIAQLRREEDFKDLANSIADAAIYVFLSEPRITGPIKAEAVRVAAERFGHRLPRGMIEQIVQATISAELLHRREQAAARDAEMKRRADGSGSSVLRSRRIRGGRRWRSSAKVNLASGRGVLWLLPDITSAS
jgi:alkanesulfonate monooxygenase SsuD/methylene tetrahydromethanopterin reductase-like flavin-dependent oxidoreductase (luciferase family)